MKKSLFSIHALSFVFLFSVAFFFLSSPARAYVPQCKVVELKPGEIVPKKTATKVFNDEDSCRKALPGSLPTDTKKAGQGKPCTSTLLDGQASCFNIQVAKVCTDGVTSLQKCVKPALGTRTCFNGTGCTALAPPEPAKSEAVAIDPSTIYVDPTQKTDERLNGVVGNICSCIQPVTGKEYQCEDQKLCCGRGSFENDPVNYKLCKSGKAPEPNTVEGAALQTDKDLIRCGGKAYLASSSGCGPMALYNACKDAHRTDCNPCDFINDVHLSYEGGTTELEDLMQVKGQKIDCLVSDKNDPDLCVPLVAAADQGQSFQSIPEETQKMMIASKDPLLLVVKFYPDGSTDGIWHYVLAEGCTDVGQFHCTLVDSYFTTQNGRLQVNLTGEVTPYSSSDVEGRAFVRYVTVVTQDLTSHPEPQL